MRASDLAATDSLTRGAPGRMSAFRCATGTRHATLAAMKRIGGMVLLAVLMAGCGGAGEQAEQREDNATDSGWSSPYDETNEAPTGQVDGGVPEDMPPGCDSLAVGKAANEQLAADGYADDYSDAYDEMADAMDCPDY